MRVCAVQAEHRGQAVALTLSSSGGGGAAGARMDQEPLLRERNALLSSHRAIDDILG